MYKTVETFEEMIAISQGKKVVGNIKRIPAAKPKNDTFIDFGCRKPVVPEGNWPFEILSVGIERNCDTKYGKRDRVVIEYRLEIATEEEPKSEVTLKQKYLVSNHPTSQFAKLVETLTGRAIAHGVEISDFIGIRGLAEVTHNTNTNCDTFANIVELTYIAQVGQSLVSGCI